MFVMKHNKQAFTSRHGRIWQSTFSFMFDATVNITLRQWPFWTLASSAVQFELFDAITDANTLNVSFFYNFHKDTGGHIYSSQFWFQWKIFIIVF